MRIAPMLIAGVLSAVSLPVQAANTLVMSLEQAIHRALRANHGQLALVDQVEMAEIDYASARAAYKTKFMASSRSDVRSGAELGTRSGVYLRKRNVSGSALSAGFYNSEFDDKSLSEMRFTYTLPIFQDKFSEGELELTRADLEQLRRENMLVIGRQELAKQVTDAYYRLIIAGDRERLALANLDIAERGLTAQRIKQESGRLSEIDVERAELKYYSAEQSVETASFSKMQAEDQFKMLLGMQFDEIFEIDPNTSLWVDETLVGAPPDLLEEAALSQRIELQGKRNEIDIARRKLHNISETKLPAIDIDLHYAFVGEGDNTSDSFDLDDQTWGVGFRMDTDFAGTERKNRRRKLYLMFQAKERELEQLERRVRMEVRNAAYETRRQSRLIELQDRELNLARRQHAQSMILYENDQLNELELLESERKLREAEHQELSARVNYMLSVMELGLVTGQETLRWD